MSRLKERLRAAFFSLPNQSKIKLYRRLYQGKTPLLSGGWAWLQWKCRPQEKDTHDIFLDYSETPGVYTPQQLIERLATFDVVSFDIFDTLLFRRVNKPTDVFSLVEQRLSVPGFAQYRAESEWRARQEKHEKGGSWEVTFSEIYAQMSKYSAAQRTQLQQAELSIENEQLYPNPVMQQLVEELLAKGIAVFAISDMYFGQETLTQLLLHCGFPPFSRIYVSSEEGVSKSEGTLFKRVEELERWKRKRVAHIGDNFYSDVLRANENGIHGIHYLKGKNRLKEPEE